jgi:hypothetical protein
MKAQRESRGIAPLLPLTSMLYEGGWLMPRPGHFTPGNNQVPIIQEAGWAPSPACTGAENSPLTGTHPPDRPARRESLYRLSYLGSTEVGIYILNTRFMR